MIIKTRGKEYYVLNELERNPEVFACRELGSTDSIGYTILRLPIGVVSAEMIKFLMVQVKNESFIEFVDYTTDDEYLYMVMTRPEGRDFREMVNNGELSFTERLIMGKKCLEHLFLSDFPEYFIHSALRGGSFLVTEALDVNFVFNLSDFLEYEDIGLYNAAEDMAMTFKNIFWPELNRAAFDPMAEFIDKLNSGAYRTLMDIYRDYGEIFKAWQGKESYELPSRTKWEKFKAWCKKAVGVLRSLVVYLILIVSLVYLADSIYQLTKPYEQKKIYDKIGDIFIINSGEEEIDGE